jgi:hypothetical protein
MALLGSSYGRKDLRKAARVKSGSTAWIRLDEGFAVRQCKVLDLSDTGVQITIDRPDTVAGTFRLLLSRSSGTGRRCRVKWRRGTRIGAQFL